MLQMIGTPAHGQKQDAQNKQGTSSCSAVNRYNLRCHSMESIEHKQPNTKYENNDERSAAGKIPASSKKQHQFRSGPSTPSILDTILALRGNKKAHDDANMQHKEAPKMRKTEGQQ